MFFTSRRFIRVIPGRLRRSKYDNSITRPVIKREENERTQIPIENAYLLIPKQATPTPRYNASILTDISTELHKSREERKLPNVFESKSIREHAIMPSSDRVKKTKGKLKHSIKQILTQPDSSVEYLQPMSPRKRQIPKWYREEYAEELDHDEEVNVAESSRSKRADRMGEKLKYLIAEIIHQQLASHRVVNSSTVNIIGVKVTEDMKVCSVKWAPLDNSLNQLELERYQRAMNSVGGKIRWHVTSKLSYLRHSPEIVFHLDK